MVNVITKRNSIFFIICLALALRIIGLDKSFQGDEFFSILDARNFYNIQHALILDTHPPLYFYILHLWMKISMNEAFLRLLSIIPGIGICCLVYTIGRESIGHNVGIISALIVTFAPNAVWSAQYIRTYSLATFFFALSIYCLVLIMNGRERNNSLLVYFILAIVSSIYTFYFLFLSIIALNIFVFLYMRENIIFMKRWLLSQAIVVLLYIPWLPFFFAQKSSYIAHPQMVERIGFYIGSVHIGAIIRSILGIVGVDPEFMFKNIFSQNIFLKNAAMIFIAIFLLAAIFLVIKSLSLNTKIKNTQFINLFLFLSVIPLIFALILHQSFKIILMSHYFFPSFIFLVLLVVSLMNNLRFRYIKIAALAAVLILYSSRLLFLYLDRGADFKSAHKYIDKIITRDTTLISPSSDTVGAIVGYYFAGIPRIYYVEKNRPIQISDNNIIFLTCPNKLELRAYNEDFRSFLKKSNYRFVESRSFGDLLIERYRFYERG
jgi:uncharacterized membrane protein